jgi:hypothetical protein
MGGEAAPLHDWRTDASPSQTKRWMKSGSLFASAFRSKSNPEWAANETERYIVSIRSGICDSSLLLLNLPRGTASVCFSGLHSPWLNP